MLFFASIELNIYLSRSTRVGHQNGGGVRSDRSTYMDSFLLMAQIGTWIIILIFMYNIQLETFRLETFRLETFY